MDILYNKDYYLFNKVVKVFKEKLSDTDINGKEVNFVLKLKNFPRSKKDGMNVYNKYIIDSYFNTKYKIDELKRIIDAYRRQNIKDLYTEITTRRNYPIRDYKENYEVIRQKIKDINKEKMMKYLDKHERSSEEDMDYVSKQLLKDDDVTYESLSDVKTDWKPKEGLFLSKSPEYIAKYLKMHSKDKGQAMKRLCFYMNRAGENLKNKTVLNKVKELLKSDD